MLFKPKLTPVRVGRNIPQFQNPPDLSSPIITELIARTSDVIL